MFFWLYRASSSSAAEIIINLILVLIIWWCAHVESFLVFLEEGFCSDYVFSLQNSVSLWPASVFAPRPNWPVTPSISWLPTSHLLLPPSLPALSLSQHQGLFQWVDSLHQVTEVLEFHLQHQSIQGWFPLGLPNLLSLQSKGLSRVFSSTVI